MKKTGLLISLLIFCNILLGQNNCICHTDGDDDGITECFDRCPNTPPNVRVNSHGCPMDTDGDGVADYKDMQLITPTECQPTDKNGVGKCFRECCQRSSSGIVDGWRAGRKYCYFKSGSSKLEKESKDLLDKLAIEMKALPNYQVVVEGFDNAFTTPRGQQLAWMHGFVIINYMNSAHGIDKSRFIFIYGNTGNLNLAIVRDAVEREKGLSCPPPPFPELIK